MIGTILALVIIVLVTLAQLVIFEKLFPRLFVLWRAMIIASVVLAIIRALNTWICVLLCG